MRVNAEVRGWCERASGRSAVRSLGFLANPVLLLPSATRRPLAVLPTVGVLTPLLTPLSVQYAETASNRQQRNQLRYADSATCGNTQKQMSADCGSEGRGFESRRSPLSDSA
jgi:hypothetical protein